jgi:putative (di)nucleoside polyphosphate hydrolase
MSTGPAALPYRRNVGVVLLDTRGRVFVGQRRDSDAPAWQMPQGGIDAGETAREAALRELEEETGVPPALVEVLAETEGWLRYDLPDDIRPRVWGGRFRGQEQKWVLMRFLGDDTRIDLNAHHPEFSDWRWIAPEDVPGQIVPFKRPVYEAVLAEFAPLLAPAG